MADNQMSKNWVFTINNPRKNWHDLDKIIGYKYMVVGEEVGEDGTPHYQGMVLMQVRKRLTSMKKLLPRAHLEVMQGSSEEARDYCMKDGLFHECGEFVSVDRKGGACGGVAKAARYRSAITLAKSGDFEKMEEEHPDMYWNNYHTMKRIAMDNPKVPETLSKLDNEWIWGAPGVGKSRTARIENPGLYIKSHNKWWLGYKGEDVVLYDDLGKTDAVWAGEFLKQWADHYPFPAETKGDGSVIRPKRIVVTSNYTIEELWGHDESLSSAIRRRFKVRHLLVAIPFEQVLSKKRAEAIVIEDEQEFSEAEISIDFREGDSKQDGWQKYDAQTSEWNDSEIINID